MKLMEVFCNLPTAFHSFLQHKMSVMKLKKFYIEKQAIMFRKKILLVALKIVTLNTCEL